MRQTRALYQQTRALYQQTRALYQRATSLFVAFHLTFVFAVHGFSQSQVSSPPGVSFDLVDNAGLAHLQRVDALLGAEQWRDAVKAIRTVLENADDKMIPVGPERRDGFRRFIPLRDYCQMQLAGFANLAPKALAHYRNIIDHRALRALKFVAEERSPEELSNIAGRFFVSSSTDEAMLQVGDLEVERGHWNSARRNYEHLSKSSRFQSVSGESNQFDGLPIWLLTRRFHADKQWQAASVRLSEAIRDPSWLIYPNPSISQPSIQARLVLVSILEGNRPRAKLELELLRRICPDARGFLAGRNGNYVTILEELLSRSDQWPKARPKADWPTFAGSVTRQPHVGEEFDIADTPSWRTSLSLKSGRDEYRSREGQRVAEHVDALLSYHPIVIGERLVVQTGDTSDHVVCYKLADGNVVSGNPKSDKGTGDALPGTEIGRRYSLTGTGSRVFALVDPHGEAGGCSRVIGIDVEKDGKLVYDLRLEGAAWNDNWSFDGAPLIENDRLYVTLRNRDAVGSQVHVACFDAMRTDLLWRRKICEGEWQETAAQTLLTLSEDTLYCNTHLGVIAALQSRDGKLRWITEYPRVPSSNDHPDRNTQHGFRDLTPCLVHYDLVISAPSDCNRLFALDANTGHVIWTTRPERAADSIHLLGVGEGNLICSGDYLYWLDVQSGELVGQYPSPRAVAPGLARPSPRGYGRGVLAGDKVYWPTRESILVFRQRIVRTEIGRHPPQIDKIPVAGQHATGGNLIVAGDVLAIAAADELIIFDKHGQRTTDTQ